MRRLLSQKDLLGNFNNRTISEIDQKDKIIAELQKELDLEKRKRTDLLMKTNPKAQADEYLQEMKKLLKSQAPKIEAIVDLALQQERQQAERKDQHVTAIAKIPSLLIFIDIGDVSRERQANPRT